MIYQLMIKDPAQTPVTWLPTVKALRQPRTFAFKPGLNVLWGVNGSGKTTLTQLLARLLHCEQGGRPVVTQASLQALAPDEKRDLLAGLELQHDGQSVRHFDPSHAPGLIGGLAGFDYDFGFEGIMNARFKGSAGQTTMHRFNRLLDEILTGSVPPIEWQMQKAHVNDLYKKRIQLAERFLKAHKPPKGWPEGPAQPTVLLDEPERSYDLTTQAGIWRMIRAYATEVQFIVASHSFFALRVPGAHYIELTPGYLKKAEQTLEALQRWPEVVCTKIPAAEAAKLRAAQAERER